ncbi:hypothetical protein [Desulfurivibrio alkaliphilus]|uniref:Lipoprotein n=1 Tax=Desulfurivibrio alkaliphilus (strain DSM 19089 / UNIQEM U267 / AHT2) TaxID=589865 RepID=D6YZU8_DESAT|nr:hypothetical protein [Desulfurivibrio alkaliphilus]ADH85105.1 hypothetical protein DaAHT2_0399 [Desulfurivibrio alkaliphilus AHT 2]
MSAGLPRITGTGRRRSLLLLLFLLLLPPITGCGGPRPYSQQLRALPPEPICRVAVLPFANHSDYPLAGAVAHQVFSAQLQQTAGYQVAQEGDVRKAYQQLRIFPGQQPTPEQMRILADRLRVQLLFTGTVVEMRETPGNNAPANPVLELELQIRDGRDAVALWHTHHRRQGTDYRTAMHFGTVHTVTGLSRQVAREIINLWLKEGLTPCDASPQY